MEGGLSIAQIAAEVDRSKATVRHWLARFGLRTHGQADPRGPHAARAASTARPESITRTCRTHGQTEFMIEGRGYYRCKRCRSRRVSERQRKVKEILVAEAGGRCTLCGYLCTLCGYD